MDSLFCNFALMLFELLFELLLYFDTSLEFFCFNLNVDFFISLGEILFNSPDLRI